MYQKVKLNNPLMGTETYLFPESTNCCQSLVKLNNPLMGTETTNEIEMMIMSVDEMMLN